VNKSVQKNMFLNMLKTLISIAFPLITYPYATRVLGVNNYGMISYVNSIISYFALLATLGISTYAIREGAIYKNDKEKFTKFANEVFSINVISTLLSYFLLLMFIIIFKNININIILLIISSLSIVFTTIGVEWINIIYEDYMYITIRSFIIQIISLVLLFLFVKKPDDLYIYIIIQSLNTAMIAISNLKYIKKYYFPNFTFKFNIKKHIKPILILFSNSIAVSIYLNIDNVLLGAMIGVFFVGIYSVAVKVYTILKQIVAAIYSVTISRLTEYLKNNDIDNYKDLLNNVINNIIMISTPITIGIVCVSDIIVLLLSGKKYIGASMPLKILTISVMFAVLGGALAYCINLPHKREKKNLNATLISALINFSLNLFFIPIMKVNGAAITTLISEISVCIILLYGMKDLWSYFQFKNIVINLFKCIISSIPFIIICNYISHIFKNNIINLFLSIILCSITYFIFNFLLKNKEIVRLFESFSRKRGINND